MYISNSATGKDFVGKLYPIEAKQSVYHNGFITFDARKHKVGETLFIRTPGKNSPIGIIQIDAVEATPSYGNYQISGLYSANKGK